MRAKTFFYLKNLYIPKICSNFANADIYSNLALLSEDQSLLNKAAKYIRRLVKQMTDDPTCMTKEEYFAMLDRAEQGPSRSFTTIEELDRFIRSL